MERNSQLQKSITTILWSFPAMLLSDRFLLFGIDVVYIWFKRVPQFWEPVYYFIRSSISPFQEFLFAVALIFLSIAIAYQTRISNSNPLKYLPLFAVGAFAGTKAFSSSFAYSWCPGCEWTSWLYDLAGILFLTSILVIVFILPKSQISDVKLRISFMILFPVSFFMGLIVLNTLISGILAWNEFESDLAEFAHVFMRSPVYPNAPYIWLTSGMIFVSLFGSAGFLSGLRGIMSLKNPKLPEDE